MDDVSMLPALTGPALLLVALLGLLCLLVVRRRRDARDAVDPVVVVDEPAAFLEDLLGEAPPVDASTAPVPADESVTVRALRAQVRALEEALQSADRAPAARRPAAVARPDLAALAERAVARRTTAQDGPAAVRARVAALLARCDQPDRLVRPVLPDGASLPPSPATVPAPAPDTEALAAPAVPALEVPAAVDEPEPAEPAEPAVDPGPELVLPVPPPAPVETRRGRRRPWHTAA